MENLTLIDLLNQSRYDEILSLNNLTIEEIELILNYDLQYDSNSVLKVIDLLQKKILTNIKSEKYKSKVKTVKDLRISKSLTGSFGRTYGEQSTKDELCGICYKRLAECHLYIHNIYDAKNYYSLAAENGVNCSEEIKALDENYETRRLNAIIAISRRLPSSKEVAQYAYRLVDDRLQYLNQPLNEYSVRKKLQSCLSTYLRNEYDNLDEVTPTNELVTATEAILKGMFYLPFATEIDENRTQYLDVRARLARSLRSGLNENSSFQMYHFTMGNFPYLVKNGNGISQEFYDFICEYYNIDKSKYPPQTFVDMANYFQFFAKWVRNPVCHGSVVQEMAFKHLMEETLLKDDSWIAKIVNMTNMEYLKVNTKTDEWFEELYQKLIIYQKENSGYMGIARNIDVGKSVLWLRSAYNDKKPKELSFIMIDKLNEIGFAWEPEKIDWFDSLYEKILIYKANHNGFEGIARDKEIGAKVKALRSAYKGKGYIKLTREMVERLNAIDFVWEIKKVNSFGLFYEKLLIYKETHGGFDGVTQDEEIGSMVSAIRSAYKKQDTSKLTPEMIDSLNRIGFPFCANNSLIRKRIQQNSKKAENTVENKKDDVNKNKNEDGYLC